MPDTRSCTYEDLYYEMWEMSQRYRQIAQFRIIGKSHDERMIPMIELGKGNSCIFCLSGLTGPDRQTPKFLIRMIQEYTKAWESGWKIEEIYDVREALDKWRLCFIPLLNPDGYEIYERDFQAIRNPIYRQMLRMQEIPAKEYTGNGRGIDLRKNFPTQYYQRRQVMQQPARENETKALIRIFQEYPSSGICHLIISGIAFCTLNSPDPLPRTRKAIVWPDICRNAAATIWTICRRDREIFLLPVVREAVHPSSFMQKSVINHRFVSKH